VRIAAIVLAAGMSRRMGSAKALLPLGDRTLVEHVIDAVQRSGVVARILVVTGCEADGIKASLSQFPGVEFVHNAHYETGEMLSSIQAGVRTLLTGDFDAFFVTLVDQPDVMPQTFRVLASQSANIVLPKYNRRHGHPVLIGMSAAQEILSLAHDQTLKAFISRHSNETREIEVDDPAILRDIDTPAEYQEAMDRLKQSERESSPCPNPKANSAKA
jgi:molybdenum cofactor cytidylyltransferase